jgi:hypothetical protein
MARDEKGTDPAATSATASIDGRLIFILAAASFIVYYFSNPRSNTYYDYTFRVAENILRGRIAFTEKPPTWLNEFVPFEGFYYSVFPLGAVLSMVPFAFLKAIGLISEMPAAFIGALCAGASAAFLLLIARNYEISRSRIMLMTFGILFGTWTWTNLTMGGAWQLALAFAFVGLLGAIYFAVYNRHPLLAGAFFALAFGNRTEILLTAPMFLYLLWRKSELPEVSGRRNLRVTSGGSDARDGAMFCALPFLLGVSTLLYNELRFHSFTDFGYARIPGVLDEPWYNHGIFSIYYIPRQIWEMLLHLWELRATFPLPMPNPFSSSILISSPFLLFAVRPGARDKVLKYICWTAVLVICVVLWTHGNSGGWQFGYRYAIAILPFLFVIMLESSPRKVTPLEWAAYTVASVLNAYVTWLFHWSGYLEPEDYALTVEHAFLTLSAYILRAPSILPY